MNCIHLRNRIKESEKERDMPLYRIGQAWIPSLVIRVSFCLLIVVQPSLAINSSTRPTIIKPVKRRQILVRHPSPPPTRFFSHAEDNSREYIYIYTHVESQLESVRGETTRAGCCWSCLLSIHRVRPLQAD